jgi:hypothetical protein
MFGHTCTTAIYSRYNRQVAKNEEYVVTFHHLTVRFIIHVFVTATHQCGSHIKPSESRVFAIIPDSIQPNYNYVLCRTNKATTRVYKQKDYHCNVLCDL